MNVIRIFVSSPGDVGREREAARGLIERLGAELAGRVELRPYFWEHEPMHAAADFQGQIPPPAEFDIFVGILWSRLGSRLHSQHTRADGTRYRSGTEYEFENALEAYGRSARRTPRLLIYRRDETPLFPADPPAVHDERMRQWEALKQFIESWFTDVLDGGTFKAAFNSYRHTDDFEERLERHLRRLVEELTAGNVPEDDAAAAAVASAPPGANSRAGKAGWVGGTPYRGLQPFEFEHARVFFGRSREIDAILGQLRDRARETERCPFVLIFGSSGSGKSSLLRAGVIPLLAAGGAEGIGLFRRALLRPAQSGGDLFDGLAAALLAPESLPELAAGGRTPAALAAMLRENAPGVGQLIAGALPLIAQRAHDDERARLRDLAADCEREGRPADAVHARELLAELRFPEPRLVLGLDQLEEIFTREDRFPAENRAAFVAAVSSLVRSGYVWVVATLRSDFFARCEELPELARLKDGKGQFHLLPPDAAQLAQMIRRPAQVAGVRFEEDAARGRLDDVLRDAANDEPGSLPLLEFALEQLFEAAAAEENRRVLTHDAYENLGGGPRTGGLRGVLVKIAESTFQGLSPAARERFPGVFQRLATVGNGRFAGSATAASRQFLRRTDLWTATGSTTPAEAEVIAAFLDARLLVADADSAGQKQVAVAHEALLNEWPRLRETLEWEAGYLRLRARFAAGAAEWDREGRDPARLATGVAYAEAWEVSARERGHLTGTEADYLARSRRWNRRKLVRFAAVAAGLVLIFAALAGVAGWAAREAAARKRETQRILARSDLRRAQEMFDAGEAPGALAFLARAVENDPDNGSTVAADRLWFALTQRAWPVPVSAPMSQGDAVLSARFSPDESRLLSVGTHDGTVRLWDAATGKPVGEPLRHAKPVRAAAFSPDGRRVLTGCFDGTVRLWDAGTGQPVPGWVVGHEDTVNAVAFSARGRWAATGSRDGTVRVWDVATGQRVAELPREPENVHTLAFHPTDETRLLTISGPHARLWRLPEGKRLAEFSHADAVNSARFDPAGKRVLTAGDDGIARVWNAEDGQRLGADLRGDGDGATPVRDAVWSPDGQRLAWIVDRKVFLGNAPGGSGPVPDGPLPHATAVARAQFSPDGRRVLTGADNGRVQVWDAGTGEPLGEPVREDGAVSAAGWSADGLRLLVATAHGALRVWQAPALFPVADRLPKPAGTPADDHTLTAFALAPDGRALLAAGADGTARRWDPGKRPAGPLTWSPHRAAILAAVFSPDGRHVITGGADEATRVSLTATGARVNDRQPPDHDGTVVLVAVSPDGRRFARATETGGAQVYEFPGGQPVGKPIAHGAKISALAFRPDGRQLLTASWDRSARLWQTDTGEPAGPALTSDTEWTCAAWSPGGEVFATGSREGIVRLWHAGTSQPALPDPLQHQGAITSVRFSPDGHRLVTTAEDGTAVVWNPSTGRSESEALVHADAVSLAVFSPDSARVATAAEDGTARVWDAATGQALTEPLRHGGRAVRGLAFAPDGRTLFTGAGDGTVRAWDVATPWGAAAPAIPARLGLAAFARAVSPAGLAGSGRLGPRVVPPVENLRAELGTTAEDVLRPLRDWFFAVPARRPLTPFARVGLSDYLESRRAEETPAAREEAALLSAGDHPVR